MQGPRIRTEYMRNILVSQRQLHVQLVWHSLIPSSSPHYQPCLTFLCEVSCRLKSHTCEFIKSLTLGPSNKHVC